MFKKNFFCFFIQYRYYIRKGNKPLPAKTSHFSSFISRITMLLLHNLKVITLQVSRKKIYKLYITEFIGLSQLGCMLEGILLNQTSEKTMKAFFFFLTMKMSASLLLCPNHFGFLKGHTHTHTPCLQSW